MYEILNEVTLAYLAGIIDGEGCISIKRIRPRNRSIQHYIEVSVCFTAKKCSPIYLFSKFFGGHINRRRERRYFDHVTKAAIEWKIPNIRAYQFLELILPYLVLKKDQAKMCIAFQRTNILDKGVQKVDLDILAYRDMMYNKVSNMKVA